MLGFIFLLLLLQGAQKTAKSAGHISILLVYFFLLFCNNVTPIYSCPNFLYLTCVLILSKDKHTFYPQHTNTSYWLCSSKLQGLKGVDFSPPFPGKQDRWWGISQRTKVNTMGQPCVPLHAVCLELLNCCEMIELTLVKLWIWCHDDTCCDVTSLPSSRQTQPKP